VPVEIGRVREHVDALERDLDADADVLKSALLVCGARSSREAFFLPACDDLLDADERAAVIRELA
jgi:hypothetical protein